MNCESGIPVSTLMFLRVCSTVFSCGVVAGVCAGGAMPKLVDGFCARTFAITTNTLPQNSVTTRSLRICVFICSPKNLGCRVRGSTVREDLINTRALAYARASDTGLHITLRHEVAQVFR